MKEPIIVQTATDHVGAAELAVGRWVYRRIEVLMDTAEEGSTGAAELNYLATVAESVEEYGGENCDGFGLVSKAQAAALPTRATELGWLYISDDGPEWSASHPVESGEVPDARNIRPANATALLEQLKDAWGAYQEGLQSEARAHRTAGEDRAALQAAQARIKVLEGDKARLDWLEMQTVNVRTPLVYGSRDNFWANPDDSYEGEEHPSDLRAKVDAEIARAALLPQLGGENG